MRELNFCPEKFPFDNYLSVCQYLAVLKYAIIFLLGLVLCYVLVLYCVIDAANTLASNRIHKMSDEQTQGWD